MNKDKQRIAIAEACGWGPARPHPETGRPIWDSPHPEIEDWATLNTLPDYLNDLNAMHEAEKVLTVGQSSVYAQEIQNICSAAYRKKRDRLGWNPWHATAAQRAEAFLRTIGKWED